MQNVFSLKLTFKTIFIQRHSSIPFFSTCVPNVVHQVDFQENTISPKYEHHQPTLHSSSSFCHMVCLKEKHIHSHQPNNISFANKPNLPQPILRKFYASFEIRSGETNEKTKSSILFGMWYFYVCVCVPCGVICWLLPSITCKYI